MNIKYRMCDIKLKTKQLPDLSQSSKKYETKHKIKNQATSQPMPVKAAVENGVKLLGKLQILFTQ